MRIIDIKVRFLNKISEIKKMYLPEHIQLSWEKTVPIKGPNPDPLIFLPLHSKDGMRERKKT